MCFQFEVSVQNAHNSIATIRIFQLGLYVYIYPSFLSVSSESERVGYTYTANSKRLFQCKSELPS